jgi:lysophospholipase L1-like esterase
VVVDTLGIKGTRAANALEWDQAVWADNLQRRAPDLFVMAFGTNEATDAHQPIADYEERLSRTLDRYREAAGAASCLLVGPGDFPQLQPDGTVIPRARTSEIVDVQRRVATAHGCGFWDLRAFMGGELAMAQWVRSTPPMASPDHIHLSRRGYVRMGMALVDALMDGYDHDDPLHSR